MQMVGERERCRRIIHAEVNALRHSRGRGNTLYTTGQPCYNCLQEIMAAPHIDHVFWWEVYPDTTRDEFLYRNGQLVTENAIMVGNRRKVLIERLDWSPASCLQGEL